MKGPKTTTTTCTAGPPDARRGQSPSRSSLRRLEKYETVKNRDEVVTSSWLVVGTYLPRFATYLYLLEGGQDAAGADGAGAVNLPLRNAQGGLRPPCTPPWRRLRRRTGTES